MATMKLAILAVAVAATAMSAAGAGYPGCANPRKVTVQNLCGKDLQVTETPLANSPPLFNGVMSLRQGTHSEFTICQWTGRLTAPGVPTAEFHVAAHDGGAWYQVPNAQPGAACRMSVTPHGNPLQGHCPTAGCADHGHCFEHAVPGGNCHNVQEIKIIFFPPY